MSSGLPNDTLDKARSFIYRNARLLDRLRFAYYWEKGTKKAVLTALKGYQNDDGGFGHALEPDIRCPHSQPVPTELALLYMDDLDRYDAGMVGHIGRYLKQIALPDGGFPRAHLSINAFPHAPWWETSSDDAFSVNPTGSLLGLLMKQKAWMGYEHEPWFRLSVRQMWEHMENAEPDGYHEAVHWISFLRVFPDRALSRPYLNKLDEWLAKPGSIERNPEAQGYVHKVLDWAPRRDSYAAKFVTPEEVQLHLAYMQAEQREDGGWPISWATLSPAVELEWRGYLTVERLLTLKSYGKL
ncbi:hypothetical protein [Cohnella nanjingensis]|uniref:Squalene cyclase C-terminal domain-containing protein n=1 Tax=Cohnella nanjingensis TaxID=1387779 RepID=A0A7X0RKP4_9BACL|nr:hypothetical protein [Cohnella nanjingensis]MBB6669284.1 hypothetical protein [Cohnella nanjingensis]